MKYRFDHDYHIHSYISKCSNNPEQTTERILQYAEENGLHTICLTDHFWDKDVKATFMHNNYEDQDYERIVRSKPLPQSEKTKFLFGCESDIYKDLVIGIAPEHFDLFDFMIIPTTHLHIDGFTLSEEEAASFEGRAKAWVYRLEFLLDQPLPFHKIGIPHLTSKCIIPWQKPDRADLMQVLQLIPDTDMERLLAKASQVGVGIELNSFDMKFADSEADIVLRPYRIAKHYGCKFYCGSDAHHPKGLQEAKAAFERAIDMLDLKETDKFHIGE